MPKLRVHNLSTSLDGYVAGPGQDLGNPLGVGGERLHEWIFASDIPPADQRFVDDGDREIGATIMGRNMFGPIRGPWGNSDWKGWWGDDPPFHHPVFVLTHHQRPSVEMEGGTIFHFVDDPIEKVLDRAFDAANGKDVRLGGGASTVQQYLRAKLVDEMHVPIIPTLLGSGERLFDGAELEEYEVVEVVSSPAVAHFRIGRTPR